MFYWWQQTYCKMLVFCNTILAAKGYQQSIVDEMWIGSNGRLVKLIDQLFEPFPIDGLYDIIRYDAVFLGLFDIVIIHRWTNHVNVDFFAKFINKGFEGLQKLPSIHHWHIDIKENNIGELVRVLAVFPKIVDSFLTIVKYQYVFA